MRRLSLIAVLIAVASTAAAQGTFEYWKAGAHTKRTSRTPLPGAPSTSRVQHAPRTSVRPTEAWTMAWFSDRAAVSRQIQALRDALDAPMIEESYPLPRGGGFRCTGFDASPRAAGDPEPWAMRCFGPDASCDRVNYFACPAPGASPVLLQVRWSVRVRDVATSSAWRPYYRALADSLTRAFGPAVWIERDSTAASWQRPAFTVTARLHASPGHPDSLEIVARSPSLPPPTARPAAP